MTSTSRIAEARTALVDYLAHGPLTGKVHYAWPGPNAANQPELVWFDNIVDWTQEIPNIKAGRKQRQETFTFELVIWVAKPEAGSTGHKATFDRAVELCGVIEGRLADDVQANLDVVQWITADNRQVDLIPFQSGWCCQIILQITGTARLT